MVAEAQIAPSIGRLEGTGGRVSSSPRLSSKSFGSPRTPALKSHFGVYEVRPVSQDKQFGKYTDTIPLVEIKKPKSTEIYLAEQKEISTPLLKKKQLYRPSLKSERIVHHVVERSVNKIEFAPKQSVQTSPKEVLPSNQELEVEKKRDMVKVLNREKQIIEELFVINKEEEKKKKETQNLQNKQGQTREPQSERRIIQGVIVNKQQQIQQENLKGDADNFFKHKEEAEKNKKPEPEKFLHDREASESRMKDITKAVVDTFNPLGKIGAFLGIAQKKAVTGNELGTRLQRILSVKSVSELAREFGLPDGTLIELIGKIKKLKVFTSSKEAFRSLGEICKDLIPVKKAKQGKATSEKRVGMNAVARVLGGIFMLKQRLD